MTKVVILQGQLINIGPWDYQQYTVGVPTNPYPGGDENAPDDWDFAMRVDIVTGNPLPEGAIEDDREVVESAKGRLLLADDWESLREDAYPPIKDQLDAAWKGGDAAEEMRKLVMSIKERYPKPDEQNPA